MHRSRVALLGAATTLCLAVAVPAQAGQNVRADGGSPVVASGACTQGSTWELAAVARKRGIGVRLTIDAATAGQKWRLVGLHNLVAIAAGRKRSDADGNIVVKRRTRNLPGVDVFRIAAKNKVTKEKCRGVLTY